MLHDRFSFFIALRVLLILILCIVFAFIYGRADFFFSQIILATVILSITVELIWFTRRMAQELSRFILGIRHGDVNINFSSDLLSPAFRDMNSAFREVIHAFHQVKIEKEAKFQLLQTIIDRMGMGILTYNQHDEIIMMNKSAGHLLGTGKAGEWSFVSSKVPVFAKRVREMGNEGKLLIPVDDSNEPVQLLVGVYDFTILGQSCRLVTFHDIRSEIEQKEIEAWYRLIRVLTHEIMNSVTPLASLTDTILMILEDNGKQKRVGLLTDSNLEDIRSSVRTIRNRSEGILKFVDDYRKLTNIPQPELVRFSAADFLSGVINTLRSDLEARNILVSEEFIPPEMEINADRNLMEQVMINLISNSTYALEKTAHPLINIRIEQLMDKIVISVKDNGAGISSDKIDRIFIPFYSTREDGSGIGLSFSKQVIYMHQGRIGVSSLPGEGTVFTIHLPQKREDP